MLRTDLSVVNRRGTGMALGLVLCAGLAGCSNMDSFMDPSVVGRWERTPTRVPILTHLAAIEDEQEAWVTPSEITPDDLIPQTDVYRVGAGDILALTIWDLVARGAAETLPRQVDQNGYVEIPQLGRVLVSGLTEPEVAQAISARMADIVADPLVSVVVEQRRQQVFHLWGNVNAPGPYLVPSADYRLLEAMGAAGGIPEFVDEVLIIRQVPLTDAAGRVSPESPNDPFRSNPVAPPTREGEVPIAVTISAHGEGQCWHRDFPPHPMVSALSADGDLLRERLGPATLHFRLHADAQGLTWDLCRVRVLGVPLPRAWFTVLARESEREGRYCFEVRAEMRGIGLLAGYAGWLDVAVSGAPAAGAGDASLLLPR